MIMLWYGSAATVPTGWTICDGYGETPNLVGKFVRGGGSATALNSAGSDSVILTAANLPNHTHTVTMGVGGRGGNVNTNSFTNNDGTPTDKANWTVSTSPGCNECTGKAVTILPSYQTLLYIMRTG